MDDNLGVNEAADVHPATVGAMLRREREAQSKSLQDIADDTRIPMRHLKALEASDHDALPAITYEVGFAKSYARSLGLDEDDIARRVRDENGSEPRYDRTRDGDNFHPADPSRTPPRMLAWTAALIAGLLVAGYGIWRGFFWTAEPADPYLDRQMSAAEADQAPAAKAALPPAGPPGNSPGSDGQVVLTANKEVWVRIYNGANDTLLIKTLIPGERYEVPRQANNPMINIGRPEAVDVTLAGRPVAPLGPPERAVKDVGISAAALLARRRTAPTPAT